MEKRGQVTIFIILGIVLIAVIAVVFLLLNQQRPQTSNVLTPLQQYEQEVSTKIQSCLEQESKRTIQLIGLRGGYSLLPDNYISTNRVDVVYLIYKGNVSLQTIEDIEAQINEEIELSVPTCANLDFGSVQENSIPVATTKILNDSVSIELNYPVTITKDNLTAVISGPYSYSLDVRLGYIYNSVRKLIISEVRLKGVNYFFLDNQDFKTTVLGVSKDTIVYILEDEKSNIDGQPFTFMFANKVGEA